MTAAKISKNGASQPLKVDILVIGGGLAGGTLSLALAQNGFRVATVDIEDTQGWTDRGFDGRASAIALSSQRVLDGVGLWAEIKDETAPIKDIRVADGNSPLFLHYDHTELGNEPFGYMVENRSIRKGLNTLVPKTKNLSYFAPNTVQVLDRAKNGVFATLNDGREIRADLVVACDGRRSPTREGAGIKLTSWDYKQAGIVCTVEHERPHDFCAQEHFLPSGPFAILPLPGTAEKPACRSSIVWTERADLWPIMMKLNDEDFLEELELRFGDFLGAIEVVGPRFAYPLSLQYAETYIAERLALVADSAHGMHPIAGQGLNMGLRDVAALAEVLVEARRLGQDIGAMNVLEKYQQWRRFDNDLMLGVTDVLVKLFSNDIEPLKLARDLGMATVNQFPDLKRFFMRHAMGTVGDLPRLMRGETL
ncbi:UbiH/UbiF/VisC/COQ6 family ubiquinone biosynthesis hydroxylase [Magnetovibrio blakemorei]|uniref:2-octaprenyl-6-methoxyphenyl hydroxylase n=1 Tax=Magnetovibrio blakemorei TaxID=28181 RepID=A0A1E5Q3C2_9PROT|nr:UbiH/UbiF/VisC/COQ6 family ubiquinone biosynthesis hydroxylase [Magnetovibrio blakemorei]OEJ64105.1 2-octaprenyl-6-methoxyphenyl hydroxylase [Magnetovibrio blakemorei]